MNMKKINFEKTIEGKMMKYATENKVYCTNSKCSGHGVVFYSSKTDRLLCPNCNEWIYKDPQTELKYKMKEKGVNVNDSKI